MKSNRELKPGTSRVESVWLHAANKRFHIGKRAWLE